MEMGHFLEILNISTLGRRQLLCFGPQISVSQEALSQYLLNECEAKTLASISYSNTRTTYKRIPVFTLVNER